MKRTSAAALIVALMISAGTNQALGFGDGTHAVGYGMTAGTHQAPGGPDCQWTRYGPGGVVLQQGGSDRLTTVTVERGDTAFQTSGCGEWSASGSDPTPPSSQPSQRPPEASRTPEAARSFSGYRSRTTNSFQLEGGYYRVDLLATNSYLLPCYTWADLKARRKGGSKASLSIRELGHGDTETQTTYTNQLPGALYFVDVISLCDWDITVVPVPSRPVEPETDTSLHTWPDDTSLQWRWLDDGQYSCDYGDGCAGMIVVATAGCSRDLYVELQLLDADGTVVGSTNETSGALSAGQQAKLVFEVFDEEARSVRPTEMSCY